MHTSYLALALLPLALAKPCPLTPTRPLSCDYDRWHQERRTMLPPNVQINVQCYSLGRSVQGNGKWLYVNAKECWVPAGVFGRGCGDAVPYCGF
ncbi:hypothetical protein CC86DRAFT_412132 [Ophiobolus disseminans]|uniref:Uncharacterized protein n=1 Tax=Ophiobolus disseminans TaxID=1469910 RepID=A0A6A6ZGK9_9PLEO|nr:hypothetical protein CC86DRAFT_412132 [Ophiobolus disseminans]